MIKIGFSSLVCPGWDFETIVSHASSMGFDGVELRGLCGELELPLVPELAANPAGVRTMLKDRGVELVCLTTSATLDSCQPANVAAQKAIVTECIELAGELGCPNIRLFAGEVQPRDHHRRALVRIADALTSLASVAGRCGVTILLENGGDFVSSEDLWFIVDAVGHPSVGCCWNQCQAMTVGERPTNSIPRLGGKLGLVHLCDAEFDAQGVLTSYESLGEGQVEVPRQVELLRGIGYDGYLVFEWPRLWLPTLPNPEAVLPDVATQLRGWVDHKQSVLSAYKGDKRAPKFATR